MKKITKLCLSLAMMTSLLSFTPCSVSAASDFLEVTCCEGHSEILYYISNTSAQKLYTINSSVYVDRSKAYVLSNTSTATTVYVPSVDTEAFYSVSTNKNSYSDAYSTTSGYFFKSNLVGEITASSSIISSYCCSNPNHTTGEIVGYNPHYERSAVNSYSYLYAGLTSGQYFSLSSLDNRTFIATSSGGYTTGISTNSCGYSASASTSCVALTDVQLTLDTYGEVTLTFDEHLVNGRNAPIACNDTTTLSIRLDNVKPQITSASLLNGVAYVSATDNATGVANYGYSYTNNTSDIVWKTTTSFAVTDTKDVYLWAKDGVGNISETYYIPYIKTITASNTTVSTISSYTYTGSAIAPTPTVVYSGTTLARNTDYTLNYSNNTNAGTATVTITGMGTYEGSISKTFTISTRTVADASFSTVSSYTYIGSAITPTPTVTVGGRTLTSGTDYTISYSNNTNVGTATIKITGKGNYTSTTTASKTFTISTRTIADATFSTVSSYTYTGSAITPTPTVTAGGRTLASGTDYTISYSNNTNVGTATIKVTGKGNYTSTTSASKTFTISTRTISDASISGISSYTYTGSAITPTPTITAGGRTLTSGTDYTISYSNNTNVGTATITITGKGNYTSTTSVKTTFSISTRTLSDASFSGISSYTYTGSVITPTPTITAGGRTLTSGTDYTISYSNNTNVGTATLTITGKGNYTSTSTATTYFLIGSQAISSATFDGLTNYTYTGYAITPTPIVIVNGKTLTSGADYSISYSNNINAGSGTITITGIGNYSYNASTNFEISQKDFDENNVYISTIPTQQYTGAEIIPSFSIVDNAIGNVLIQGYDYSALYYDNISSGTATIEIVGKGNYVGTIEQEFKIINSTLSGSVEGSSVFVNTNLNDRIYSTYGFLENDTFTKYGDISSQPSNKNNGIYLEFYVLQTNENEYFKATSKLAGSTYPIYWDNNAEIIQSTGDILTGYVYIDSTNFETSMKNSTLEITVSSYNDETAYSKISQVTQDVIVTIDVKAPVLMVDVNKYSNKVSIESYDSIAGVREVLYSVNGGNYQTYLESFVADSTTETIDVYAVDMVGNEAFYREILISTAEDFITTLKNVFTIKLDNVIGYLVNGKSNNTDEIVLSDFEVS